MNSKSDDISILEHIEAERKELNNELVVPSYRKFCRDNDLAFHFWDELPKESFDPEIGLKESRLHDEAMDLFNRLKPELNLFKSKVVRFQFVSTVGDFKYDTWDLQTYINKTAEELLYLKNLEKRFDIVVNVLSFLFACAVTYLFAKLYPDTQSSFFEIGLITVFILSYLFIPFLCERLPKYKQTRESKRLNARLTVLREKLKETSNRISGGFSPPLSTTPFYYPQVQAILSSSLFLKDFDVCLDKLLDYFSHTRIIGDHLTNFG